MRPSDDIGVLASRRGWTVAGGVATYQPTEGATRAVVRNLQVPGHTYWWLHVAIVDEVGRATYVIWATSLGEAIREAESRVR